MSPLSYCEGQLRNYIKKVEGGRELQVRKKRRWEQHKRKTGRKEPVTLSSLKK